MSCLTVLRNSSAIILISQYQSQRGYEQFEKASEVAEKVVGRRKPSGLPSWVSDRTLKLREERDKAKKRYLLVRTRHARQTLRRLNTSLMSPTIMTSLLQYNNRWKIYRKLTGRVVLIQYGKSSTEFLVRIDLLQRCRNEMALLHPVTPSYLQNGAILCRITQQ